MPAYEAGEFTPPAPVARVRVLGPAGDARDDIPLLIDTGADVSIIPRHVAAEVGAEIRASNVPLRFFDESEMDTAVATLTVELLRFRFQGQFVVADAPVGVLGRNILNLLVLTLDGPRQAWSA